jgi:hypothetical protein
MVSAGMDRLLRPQATASSPFWTSWRRYARLISVGTFATLAHAIDWAAWRLIPSTSQLEMFGELSISTQSGLKIAGAVSSRAACSPTAAAPPPSETEADDAAFPSLEALYCRLRPIFQVRASGELAWRSTRKGVCDPTSVWQLGLAAWQMVWPMPRLAEILRC